MYTNVCICLSNARTDSFFRTFTPKSPARKESVNCRTRVGSSARQPDSGAMEMSTRAIMVSVVVVGMMLLLPAAALGGAFFCAAPGVAAAFAPAAWAPFTGEVSRDFDMTEPGRYQTVDAVRCGWKTMK